MEEVVELAGELRDGLLVTMNQEKIRWIGRTVEGQKHRNDNSEEGQGSSGKNDELMQDSVEFQKAKLAREEVIRMEMLERQKIQKVVVVVEQSRDLEQINKEFAIDAERMEFKSDVYSQETIYFEEEMVESTQMIKERV